MAKKSNISNVSSVSAAKDKEESKSPQEIYESHNDATAREWNTDKQCQCDDCQSYLGR